MGPKMANYASNSLEKPRINRLKENEQPGRSAKQLRDGFILRESLLFILVLYLFARV